MNIIDTLLVQRDLWTVGALMRKWHENLFRHSVLTADLAAEVVRLLGFPDTDIEFARLAGFLHDVGKVTWPKELQWKHPLDEKDWQIVRVHPIVGAKLVEERIPSLSRVVFRVIEEHHERDGDGYPHGLKMGDLHPLSRIVACVECFIALVEYRPYRPCPLSCEQVLQQIAAEGFEVGLVESLKRAVSDNGLMFNTFKFPGFRLTQSF